MTPYDHPTRMPATDGSPRYKIDGISGNSRALGCFWHEVKQLWHYWLKRRSRAAKEGERLWQLMEERFRLPPARLVHKTNPQRQWSLSP